MSTPVEECGLKEAIAVADGLRDATTGEGDAKLLGFFLRDGECTAEVSEELISVWYSWLPRPKPSTYFVSLAPGLVGRLMELGGVPRLVKETTFQVGPGTTGTGRYVFDFPAKWVRIRRDDNRMIIRVRDREEDLNDKDPEHFGKVVHCERCQAELRTHYAKQCVACGHDWH